MFSSSCLVVGSRRAYQVRLAPNACFFEKHDQGLADVTQVNLKARNARYWIVRSDEFPVLIGQ